MSREEECCSSGKSCGNYLRRQRILLIPETKEAREVEPGEGGGAQSKVKVQK